MRHSRFTEEQIIGVLKEALAGVKVGDLVRKHGISEHTFYRWKAKYGGMEVSDARRLRQLEDENRRLKSVVADLTLDDQALEAVLGNAGEGSLATGSGRVRGGHRNRSPGPRDRPESRGPRVA